ncbi:hypothetical protein [Aquariibacter albus]|uniref:Uncharacterized protein n=1 Tax=Aquariibacter albus TaxID=2759899 RepID=A0A839HP03_9BURK|nr:hypothetical protein [Aquariibacter albus]MBB1163222.1 hypothetical protein [Aquariibacter albus]
MLIPSGPAHDPERKHLHIVLTDPVDGQVQVVSVSSIPQNNLYDGSCTLFAGEHPFVKHDSWVVYRFARLVKAQLLERKVADGEFIAKPVLDAKVYQFVVDGLLDSPQASPKMKQFLRDASGL